MNEEFCLTPATVEDEDFGVRGSLPRRSVAKTGAQRRHRFSTADRASKAAERFASRRSPKRFGCGYAAVRSLAAQYFRVVSAFASYDATSVYFAVQIRPVLFSKSLPIGGVSAKWRRELP
jgi:hypothetical protein